VNVLGVQKHLERTRLLTLSPPVFGSARVLKSPLFGRNREQGRGFFIFSSPVPIFCSQRNVRGYERSNWLLDALPYGVESTPSAKAVSLQCVCVREACRVNQKESFWDSLSREDQ